MTLPEYTDKELEFFRSALEILEYAISGIAMQEPECVSLHETFNGSTNEAVQETEAELNNAVDGQTEPAVVIEKIDAPAISVGFLEKPVISIPGEQTGAVYFQALPWQKTLPKVIVSHGDIKVTDEVVARVSPTSAAFFQNLPWQQLSSGPRAGEAKETAEKLSVGVNQPCLVFFQTLPWQKPGFDSIAREVSVAAVKVDAVVTETSLAYFKALPWQKLNSGSPVSEQKEVTETLAGGINLRCPDFFRTLPWQQPGTIATAGDAGLLANKAETFTQASATYFQTLPWQLQDSDKPVSKSKDILESGVGRLTQPYLAFFQTLPWQTSDKARHTRIAVTYFRSLPWHANKPNSMAFDLVSSIGSEDFASVMSMATRTALQTAKLDANKGRAELQGAAQDFFHALPW